MDQQAHGWQVPKPKSPENLDHQGRSSPLTSVSSNATATAVAARRNTSPRVAFGDANHAVIRRLLHEGSSDKLFASHQAHGGHKTFWQYIPASLTLVRAPMVVRDIHPAPVCLEPHLIPRGNGFTLELDDDKRRMIHEATVTYCREHPDEVINVQAAGVRAPGIIPVDERLMHTDTFCRTSQVNCLRAAVANAIFRFSSVDATRFLEMGSMPDDRFTTLTAWLDNNHMRYQLRQCPRETSPPDSWVMDQTEGVFVLIINGFNSAGFEVEHVVTVDAEARVIIDSCEDNLLQFSWSVLQKCIGNAHYLGGVDVRRVYYNPPGNGRTHRRNRNRRMYKLDKENNEENREMTRHLAVHRPLQNFHRA